MQEIKNKDCVDVPPHWQSPTLLMCCQCEGQLKQGKEKDRRQKQGLQRQSQKQKQKAKVQQIKERKVGDVYIRPSDLFLKSYI